MRKVTERQRKRDLRNPPMSKEEAKDLRISVDTISKKSSPNFETEIVTISSLFETYKIPNTDQELSSTRTTLD